MTDPTPSLTAMREQATHLRLPGLLAHWSELTTQPEAARMVGQWLAWETEERARRSLERRLRDAHIGQFKALADFDWTWPTHCDRALIDELMTLEFLAEASNIVLSRMSGDSASHRSAATCAPRPGASVVIPFNAASASAGR